MTDAPNPHRAGPPAVSGRRAGARRGPGARHRLFGWFMGVNWSPSYIAFLIYIVTLVSSRIQIGTEAMAVALVAVDWRRVDARFPPPLFS